MNSPSPVSPVFVGREAELAELTQAAQAADNGDPQALLVRGEAGVGKTWLVEELLRTLGPGRAIAAVGGCIEVGGDGIPFAPFAETLRTLWQRLPDEVRAASAGHEGLLARILPDLDTATPVDHRDDDVTRLFEFITRILERLASSRLVVLVIEDLHWADASTRNLLSFLFRTRRTGRLLLLATYRSDDVHGRHPLRPLLAELDRLRSVRRIELARFTRLEVTEQLTGILGAPPEPAVLSEIFARSDGNAFFVEELARAHSDHMSTGLDNLHDVLLTRLESLPDTSQRLVRMASQGGAVIGYPLLRAVVGLPEEELIESLRVAVLARVLVPEPNGSDYRFRHSLVREAVSDNLLPGERALINRQYGEAIEADTSLVRADELTGRLAQHWHAAHDDVKALRMSVSAAEEARNRCAYTEQLWLLERAIQLWDGVPDEDRLSLPALRCPETYPRSEFGHGDRRPRRPDLYATATVAALHSGDLDKALHLADGALERLSADDLCHSLRAAWFWLQRSRLVEGLNRGDGWRELETALDLVSDLPPSAVQADILVQIAAWNTLHRPAQARPAAERAVDYAGYVGAEELELSARISLCMLDAETDVDGTSIVTMYKVRRQAEELGELGLIGRANQTLASMLEGMDRSDEAIAAADHGIEICRSLGLIDRESWLHSNRSLSLFSLGRWDESEAALDKAQATARSHQPRWTFAARGAYCRLLRGDVDGAATRLAHAHALRSTDNLQVQFLIPLSQCTMDIMARQGDLSGARAEFLRADGAGLTTGPVRWSLPLLWSAAAIEAEARRSAGPGGASAEVLTAVRRAAARLEVVFPASHAIELLLEAELQRAEGDDDPDRWSAAVAALETMQRPYELAAALLGKGRALLTTREHRAAGLDRLARAHRLATSLGAGLILADIETLTRQADGVTPPRDSPPSGERPASLGLTPRESEVLRLVTRGYSNRRISEELYISQKTTSTHVSNILAKLGASSRTEAAAIAHRSGL